MLDALQACVRVEGEHEWNTTGVTTRPSEEQAMLGETAVVRLWMIVAALAGVFRLPLRWDLS